MSTNYNYCISHNGNVAVRTRGDPEAEKSQKALRRDQTLKFIKLAIIITATLKLCIKL